jgi:serine/threonine protein kinase
MQTGRLGQQIETLKMALEAGTKLGRYEIRAKIGEGGMGEVYLALSPPTAAGSPLRAAPSLETWF